MSPTPMSQIAPIFKDKKYVINDNLCIDEDVVYDAQSNCFTFLQNKARMVGTGDQ